MHATAQFFYTVGSLRKYYVYKIVYLVDAIELSCEGNMLMNYKNGNQ